DLPAPLLLGQAEVPVDQVQWAVGRVDNDELGAARLAAAQPQRHLELALEGPARQDQVAVAPLAVADGELEQVGGGAEVPGQQGGGVVVVGAAAVAVDFLEADEVGVGLGDDTDDAVEAVAAVAAADALVDVVGQQSHRRGTGGRGGGPLLKTFGRRAAA